MKKVVLGIGNILLRDEGIGCHVARALESRFNGALFDVRVIEGGTCLDVLPLLEGADKLVIVDAVKSGGEPGQIYRFPIEDITLEQKPFLSLHDMTLVNSLILMQIWRNAGETVVIGVEPKEIDWGLELSAELREKMPQIIDVVLSEINTSPKGELRC